MVEADLYLTSNVQSPLVVACNDAGAANLIFAWIRDWSESGILDQYEIRMVLQGPARDVWSALQITLPNLKLYKELSTAFNGACSVITGTGWASNFEHEARKQARLGSIPCVAVIDHWVNYQQRFEREGEVVLPDAIWVADQYASEMARSIFSDVPVVELSNAYLNDMVKKIPRISVDCRTLLYVLEPIRTGWGRSSPGEFQALDFFIRQLHLIVGNLPIQILLRPHPSDDAGKYDAWINDHKNLNVSLSPHTSLHNAIASSKWVVGVESYALVVAAAAGRQVYSSMPPWGHRCRLPQNQIIHLRDLA